MTYSAFRKNHDQRKERTVQLYSNDTLSFISPWTVKRAPS